MSPKALELIVNYVLVAFQICLGTWQFTKLTPVGALIQGGIRWLLRPLGFFSGYAQLKSCQGRVFKKANCFVLQADIPSQRTGILSENNTINLHYLGGECNLERNTGDENMYQNMLFIDKKMCYYITHTIWKELQTLEEVLRYGIAGPPAIRSIVASADADRAQTDAANAEVCAERAEPDAENAAARASTAEADAPKAAARASQSEASAAQAKVAARADAQAAAPARADALAAAVRAVAAAASCARFRDAHAAARAAARAAAFRAAAPARKDARAAAVRAGCATAAEAEAEATAARAKAKQKAAKAALREAQAIAEAAAKAKIEAEATADAAVHASRSKSDALYTAAREDRAAANAANDVARAARSEADSANAAILTAPVEANELRKVANAAHVEAENAEAAAKASQSDTVFIEGYREFWEEVITGGVMSLDDILDGVILDNKHVSLRLNDDWLLPVNLSVSEEKLVKIINLFALFLQTKTVKVHWLIPISLSFISALLEFSTTIRVWLYRNFNLCFCYTMHLICDPLPRSCRRQVYSLGKWVEKLKPCNDMQLKVVRDNMHAIISGGARVDKEGATLVLPLQVADEVRTQNFGVIQDQFFCDAIQNNIRCAYVRDHDVCEISAPTIGLFYVKCNSMDDFKNIITLVSCIAKNRCGSLISCGLDNKVRVRGFKDSIFSYVNSGLPPIYELELENVVAA